MVGRFVNQPFSGGSKLSTKAGSTVYKMNNSFVWERHPQQMAFARSGHRVVKDGKTQTVPWFDSFSMSHAI